MRTANEGPFRRAIQNTREAFIHPHCSSFTYSYRSKLRYTYLSKAKQPTDQPMFQTSTVTWPATPENLTWPNSHCSSRSMSVRIYLSKAWTACCWAGRLGTLSGWWTTRCRLLVGTVRCRSSFSPASGICTGRGPPWTPLGCAGTSPVSGPRGRLELDGQSCTLSQSVTRLPLPPLLTFTTLQCI